MFVLTFLSIFAFGAWDSGAFDNGGFDWAEIENGSNGKACEFVDTKVLGYDGSRCPGDR